MHIFLYMVIFWEGFVVLSAELLAIRQMLPVAGSGTDVISIVIAAVLMPLAFGYYAGGRFVTEKNEDTNTIVKNKLARNFWVASLFFIFALSQLFIEGLFEGFQHFGLMHRLPQVSIYAACFLVVPVYLLGQTIPLIVNLIQTENISRLTGKILWFSTIGSFLGAITTSLIFMAFWGVNNTVILIVVSLLLVSLILRSERNLRTVALAVLISGLVWTLNSPYAMSLMGVVRDNAYNNIKIHQTNNQRILSLNNNFSAAVDEHGAIPPYVKFIETSFIKPIADHQMPKKRILILGAGGFTMGMADDHNDYTYVDIDPALLPISEEYILNKKLGENKTFIAKPARAYLKQVESQEKFDLIIIDLFKGWTTPEHLVTQEFFASISRILSDEGRLVMNTLTCPNHSDQFSLHLDQTIRSVFAGVNTHIMSPEPYDAWKDYRRNMEGRYCEAQVLYVYLNSIKRDNVIYSDNQNQVYADY